MSARWNVCVELPLRIDSRSAGNVRMHRMALYRKRKAQRAATLLALTSARVWHDEALRILRILGGGGHGVCVTLERVAPRALDAHDNLRHGLKAVADAVAEWLGMDDADERLAWSYWQTPRGPRQYGVRIHLEVVPPLRSMDGPWSPVPKDTAAHLNLYRTVERALKAEARIAAVASVLERVGCDCSEPAHPDDRMPDAELCLACEIQAALGSLAAEVRR